MDGADGVVAWRESLDLEFPIGVADGVERLGGDVHVGLHPRMLITFERHHRFRIMKALLDGSAFGHLGNIPLRVAGGVWLAVDVVRGGIAV